ncbi:MAG TPA: helix-turn-helix domain-containing protein [Candidatus Syntrophoarchaeum butanivorans]|uniref:Type II methyltransferase n=3 Tax=Candidatus Syntropharchaeum butanivorans TaxID=1839936 RepID=A0A1F2P3H5_9EURY|nr:MAG: SAM-dependent methyltransferase [Candidatus Syntrophoarchaeum butanivorans]HEC56550.1 helix-turn-helix domain-containing protein [Candidatus Syntrophoarchaeum butanivorans]
MTGDYRTRSYLSSGEAAKYLGISVSLLHELVRQDRVRAYRAASGQYRFRLEELQRVEGRVSVRDEKLPEDINVIEVNETVQRVYVRNAQRMDELEDNSIHLMVTSPPYFNAKMYSKEPIEGDLGDIHDLDEWFEEIGKVWKEVFRVLQPGRRAFINIMNLPIRTRGSFRTLNLVGRTIDICEKIGFILKRDIVWHKTNSVRAHFGTYPYPGGILLNHAHEFILEFEKPAPPGYSKYSHLTDEQKEASKLDKEFWISLKKSDVWVMKPEGSGDRREHVAPFPYELPFRLIKAYSFIGETVLDPFLGSGTTLVAARDLKRNGVGYEINREIAAGAIRRIKNYQRNLFEGEV